VKPLDTAARRRRIGFVLFVLTCCVLVTQFALVHYGYTLDEVRLLDDSGQYQVMVRVVRGTGSDVQYFPVFGLLIYFWDSGCRLELRVPGLTKTLIASGSEEGYDIGKLRLVANRTPAFVEVIDLRDGSCLFSCPGKHARVSPI